MTFSRRDGLTLVELLVVLGIAALLLAILLPTLGGAKETSKELRITLHLHEVGRESVLMYAEDRGGELPYYGVPGTDRVIEFEAPFGAWAGQSFSTYWHQTHYWNLWAHLQGYDGTLAANFPDNEHDYRTTLGASRAMMTGAAFAEPRYFSGDVRPDEAVALHRGQRLSDVRTTSSKALLLLDVGDLDLSRWVDEDVFGADAFLRGTGLRWRMFFADGHVGVHGPDEMAPGAATPQEPFGIPVMSTKNGILGRDVR